MDYEEILILPTIVDTITRCLNPLDLLSFDSVCVSWRIIYSSNSIWKKFAEEQTLNINPRSPLIKVFKDRNKGRFITRYAYNYKIIKTKDNDVDMNWKNEILIALKINKETFDAFKKAHKNGTTILAYEMVNVWADKFYDLKKSPVHVEFDAKLSNHSECMIGFSKNKGKWRNRTSDALSIRLAQSNSVDDRYLRIRTNMYEEDLILHRMADDKTLNSEKWFRVHVKLSQTCVTVYLNNQILVRGHLSASDDIPQKDISIMNQNEWKAIKHVCISKVHD